MKRYLSLVGISVFFWIIGSTLIAKAESNTLLVDDYQVQEVDSVSERFWSDIYVPGKAIEADLISGGPIGDKWLGSYSKALYWDRDDSVIIYGHNTKDIFANLKEVDLGDTVVMTTISGQQIAYTIYDISEVSPNDYHVLDDEQPNLIIVTCSGKWDEKRLVVKAKSNKLES